MDGQKLPPEREMAASLQTSVGTLRKALDQLVSQGRVERIQGSGNYIRADLERDSVYSLFRIERRNGRGKPSAEVLSVDYLDKPTGLPTFGSSAMGNRVRRLRRLDDVAVAVEEIWLDGNVGKLDANTLGNALYADYAQQFSLMISHAVDAVAIGHVPSWAPENFGLLSGDACGYIERFAWSEAGECVEFSKTWFDQNQAIYVQRLR